MLLSVHTVLQNRLCTFLPLSSCTVFDIIRLQLINKPISGNFPLPANSTLLLPHLLSALLNKKKTRIPPEIPRKKWEKCQEYNCTYPSAARCGPTVEDLDIYSSVPNILSWAVVERCCVEKKKTNRKLRHIGSPVYLETALRASQPLQGQRPCEMRIENI